MYTGLIAKRYATALADYAEQCDEEREVYDEVKQLVCCYKQNSAFRTMLDMPMLKTEERVAFIANLAENGISSSLASFLTIVFEHRRGKFLHFMLHSFLRIYKERHGILDATLVTAMPLDRKTIDRIADLTKAKTGSSKVALHEQIDESVIGGFALRIDDHLIDCTLSSQLARIERIMTNNNRRII